MESSPGRSRLGIAQCHRSGTTAGRSRQAGGRSSTAAADPPTIHGRRHRRFADGQTSVGGVGAASIEVEVACAANSAEDSAVTYVTDPWGTRFEIIQRTPLKP